MSNVGGMSELDRTLADILSDNCHGCSKGDCLCGLVDEIPRLRQAFIDAGYTNDLYRKHLNDAYIDAIKKEAGFMTGREWYDRFWHEYEQPEGRNPKLIDGTIVRKDIDIIARRAAGL